MLHTAVVVNGVNVTNLFGTIDAIKDTPSLHDFTFRASNVWINGGHNRSTIQNFYGAGQEDMSRAEPFVMDADEPAVLLGEDHGANPVEYVLHALAGCLTTSLVYHAAARGIRIDALESQLEGDLNLEGFLGMSDEVRRGFHTIRATFKVQSDASPEQLAELTKYSPVYDIVSNAVPVTIQMMKG